MPAKSPPVETDELFPGSADDSLPPAMRRALAKINAADVVAAFELCGDLAPVLRPLGDVAGSDAIGGTARMLFGVEFANASRRYFANFAGLRDDAPTVPPGLLPSREAVAVARLAWARHLLRRLEEARTLLHEIVTRDESCAEGERQ
jgi:hypothetical protein